MLSHRLRLLTIAPIIVALVVLGDVAVAPAEAAGCPGDYLADDMYWGDHYWVGWDLDHNPTCDTVSTYVLNIQRVNFGLLGAGVRSPIDGGYGSLTHLDVRDVPLGHHL